VRDRDNEVEEWVTALLKEDGAFDPPTTDTERFVNAVRADILAEDDPDMVEIRTDELRSAVSCMVYGGMDPKVVPNEVMQFAIQNPSPLASVFIHVDARKRVRNPNTAIRAKCLECQGNDQVAVRQCPSFNCLLWAFRMGTNPFFGRLIGSTGEEESSETEEEIEQLEEQRNVGPA
jgi:hypothetical protein